MHCVALLIISLLLITIWICKFWKVSTQQSRIQNTYDKYLEKVNKLEELSNDLKIRDKMEVPEYYPRDGSVDDHKIYYGLIPIIILLVIFVIYGIILWAVDQNFEYALPDKIFIEKKKGDRQGVFFPLAWTIVLSYTLLCIWFRLFQRNKYKMKLYLWVFAT